MLSILWDLLAFLIATGILVTIHEFGHFWMARNCGVHVRRFCIGFGRALWCRSDRQGTEYIIACIPLGGYVQMLNERIGTIMPTRYCELFNNKPIWQRTVIISAGPVANFLFAILVYWLALILGIPTFRPVVGNILSQSIASKADILPGMEFKSIDGTDTLDWDSVRMALVRNIGNRDTKVCVIKRGSGQQIIKTLDLRQQNHTFYNQDPILGLGITPLGPQIELVLSEVQPNSAAQKAGLHVGDRIIKINNRWLDSWQTVVTLIHDSPGKPLALEIERNGLPLFLTLIPGTKETGKEPSEGFAGILLKALPLLEEYKITHKYEYLSALYYAFSKIWYLMRLTVSMLGKLIIGNVKLTALSGPITIAQGAGESARSGLAYYLVFLALISVNLGIVNLFPLATLDGGHLLFLAIEKFNGKPVSKKIQDYSYRTGSIILMLLMSLAFFNDFSRL